tara:strand:- start:651 stop:788 length:138 start_codon:yes stop_codon:yes gene_type:complete
MKRKRLLILFCLPIIGFVKKTTEKKDNPLLYIYDDGTLEIKTLIY